jgi:hypothetical protein
MFSKLIKIVPLTGLALNLSLVGLAAARETDPDRAFQNMYQAAFRGDYEGFRSQLHAKKVSELYLQFSEAVANRRRVALRGLTRCTYVFTSEGHVAHADLCRGEADFYGKKGQKSIVIKFTVICSLEGTYNREIPDSMNASSGDRKDCGVIALEWW